MKYRIDEDGGVTITFASDEAEECTEWLMDSAHAKVQSMEKPPPSQMARPQHAKDLHFARLMHATISVLCRKRWGKEYGEHEVPVLNLSRDQESKLLHELRERADPG